MVLQFKFQNGLNAKLHDIRAPHLKRFFNLCVSTFQVIDTYKDRDHCVVEVEIGEETVWLVLYRITEKAAIHKLKKAMEDLFEHVYFTVYCNRIYTYNADLKLILGSIRNKTPPSITAMLNLQI